MDSVISPEMIALEKVYLKINEIEYEIGSAHDFRDKGGVDNSGEAVSYVNYSGMYEARDLFMKEYIKRIAKLKEDSKVFENWIDIHIKLYENLDNPKGGDSDFNKNRLKATKEAINQWGEVARGDNLPVIIDRTFTPEITDSLQKIFNIE